MTDRDTFAAAALTGLIANGDYSVESLPLLAYQIADAMLRARDKKPAPPCVETDGFSPGSSSDLIDRSAERESPRRECEESQLRDVPQADNARAAGGPEHHIFEHQHPTLTDEERDAVEWAALALGKWADERNHAGDLSNRLHKTAHTLRALLKRLA